MILLGIFCGLGAVVVCGISGLKMYEKFYVLKHDETYDQYVKETRFALEKSQDLQIIRIETPRNPDGVVHALSLNIFESETDDLVVQYHFNLANVPEKETVKSLIAQPEIAWKDGEIVISFPGNSVFSDVVPFVPMSRDIELYVPRDLIFHLNTDYGYVTNTEKPEWMNKY